MIRYSFSLIFLILLGVSACNYSEEYQTVNAGNDFSVSIPGWLKTEDDLKPGAVLQYANRFRNFYMIGNTESKEHQDISTLTNRYLNVLKQSMKNPVVTDSMSVIINGLPGIRTEVYGKMNDENIYFSELVIEGKKNSFYHLSIWTRGEDRKLRFKKDIDRILNSFKEI
ncbi:MAG: hypothetical protein IPP77_05585 [Bacteroidetes bacterium]|nr:hypothetical protein [Bacteroidota bacterium]